MSVQLTDRHPSHHVADTDGLVESVSRTCQPLAIETERLWAIFGELTLNFSLELAARSIPDAHEPTTKCADDLGAVQAERKGKRGILLVGEDERATFARHAPDAHG